MPIIRPISDIRNKFHTISEQCHEEQEPIFLTKNGKGDLVVMSIELYERQAASLELYKTLGEAEAESSLNKPKITHKELMAKMQNKLNA